jgi:hypothetical protein
MQPASSIALVEMHNALEQIDELRRGNFNREHFSNTIPCAPRGVAPRRRGW